MVVGLGAGSQRGSKAVLEGSGSVQNGEGSPLGQANAGLSPTAGERHSLCEDRQSPGLWSKLWSGQRSTVFLCYTHKKYDTCNIYLNQGEEALHMAFPLQRQGFVFKLSPMAAKPLHPFDIITTWCNQGLSPLSGLTEKFPSSRGGNIAQCLFNRHTKSLAASSFD